MKKSKVRSTGTVDAQIGLRMRHIRIAQDVSQNELGEKLGVSFQQVQKYEKGVNRVSLVRAMEVAKALNTSVNELAGIDADGKITAVHFDYGIYKLAQSLGRMNTLSPELASKFHHLIESICDNLEASPKKKR